MPRVYSAYNGETKIAGGFLVLCRYDPKTETSTWVDDLTTVEALDCLVRLMDGAQGRLADLEARLNALDPAWDL
jgi:hypothetical protein